MIKVIDATIEHLEDYEKLARPMDLEEIFMVTGRPYSYHKEYLKNTITNIRALIHVETGELLGIGGLEGRGRVWLVTTNNILKYQTEFLRFSLRYRDKLFKTYKTLWNRVYVKNTLHIKWLKWLGAKFCDETIGSFRYFYLERKGDA